MFKNKRIENAKSHYKLEFDIKTDDENILAILDKIKKTIYTEFDKPCPHTRDFSRELGHA